MVSHTHRSRVVMFQDGLFRYQKGEMLMEGPVVDDVHYVRRIICPFCLTKFTVPTGLIRGARGTFDGKDISKTVVIDNNLYVIRADFSYHVHSCKDCPKERSKVNSWLNHSSASRTVLLKHSTLVCVLLLNDLLETIYEPSNYLTWSSDRSWNYRLMNLIFNAVKLQSLMAWCNTLGGAHSSLGDSFTHHAEKATAVSHNQLALSCQMGDEVLQTKSRLFLALSFLQRGRLQQAKRIIRSEFLILTKNGEKDQKLISMCLSAWNRYKVAVARATALSVVHQPINPVSPVLQASETAE